MITMPRSYYDICMEKGISSDTMYHLEEELLDHNRNKFCRIDYMKFMYAGLGKGVFRLYYVIKSFPFPTDNSRYLLYFVTRSGIFVEVRTRGYGDGIVDFRGIVAKFYAEFTYGDLLTLYPDTRQILLLKDVRYTEMIDGKGYPNSFYYESHSEIEPRKHEILIESRNYKPIVTEYNTALCVSLRNKMPYLWLRSDNYVDIHDVRFYQESY